MEQIGISAKHLPPLELKSDEELKQIGMTNKPLGRDYKDDPELGQIINTVFESRGGFAAFGTLLGLIRDGELIWDDDTDVDFYYLPESAPGVIQTIKMCHGIAAIVRMEPTFITLMTRGSKRFVDFYLGHVIGRKLAYMHDPEYWSVGGFNMKWNTVIMDGGLRFFIPNNSHHCLESWYGHDWMVKKKRADFFK